MKPNEGFIDFDPQEVPSVLKPETKKPNIFLEQAERANPSKEILVQRFLSLTQQIGWLKERMRAPDYVLNKGDVARLSQLGAEKDEAADEIKRRESLTKPTIDSNLTGRDNWVNKHRKL